MPGKPWSVNGATVGYVIPPIPKPANGGINIGCWGKAGYWNGVAGHPRPWGAGAPKKAGYWGTPKGWTGPKPGGAGPLSNP